MMLQIDHRDSDDIDIFVSDPQVLGYLNPATLDYQFEMSPDGYEGDGSNFIKIKFDAIGEIDFIVAPGLTEKPSIEWLVEGVQINLETVPEIITKKVYFRGATIKPRDIFDIAAAGRNHRDDVVAALAEHPSKVEETLSCMARLNRVFVDDAISQLMVREKFRDQMATAFEDAREILLAASG